MAYERIRPIPPRQATVAPGLFAGMINAQAQARISGAWTHGPSTLMAVLGLQRAEVANCKVIRWLLDPLAPHGLGTGMLRAFASAVSSDLLDPARARVRVEVTRGKTRADVVIEGLPGTIVIEAKIDAPEGDGRGEGQGAALERNWAEANRLVFLTRSGSRPPRTAANPARWVPMKWTWFADTAEGLLDKTTEARSGGAAQGRHALTEWITAARSNLK